MTGLNHGLNGAIIALVVKQPYLALPMSVIGHYVSDFVPHYGVSQDQVLEPKFNRFVKIDFLLSLVAMGILALLFPDHKLLIWGCMILSAIPDAIWWFYRKTVKKWPSGLDKFSAWHFKVNQRSHVDYLYFDVGWLVLAIAAIFYIKLK